MLLRAVGEGGRDDASRLRKLASGRWKGGLTGRLAWRATPSVVELEVVEAAVVA